jgi:hypothetical protein
MRDFDSRARFRFDLMSLLALITVVALVLTVFRRPAFVFVVFCTHIMIRISPLRGESLLATGVHSGVIGLSAGLVASVVVLLAAIDSNDEAFSRLAFGIITGPAIGAAFGIIYGIWQRSRPTSHAR